MNLLGKSLSDNLTRGVVVGDLALTAVDLLNDVVRVLALDGAADRLSRAKDLLNSALHLASHRARTHDFGDLDDILEGDITVVLDCTC